MDGRKLHGLITVVRAGSFNQASEELNCTQSAVTQMINSLEVELGFKILNRDHHGVRLTEAGEKIMPCIISADTALTELKREAKRLADRPQAVIHIGTFSSICNSWLPDVIAEFQGRNPGVTFDICIASTELSEWVESGKIDIALADEEKLDGVKWEPLMEDSIYAVVPEQFGLGKQDSITQEELTRFPIIKAPLNGKYSSMKLRSAKEICVETYDDTTLLHMVSRGLGVTLLAGLSLKHLPDNVDLLDLDPPITRIIGVAVTKNADKETRAFVKFLKEQHKNKQ